MKRCCFLTMDDLSGYVSDDELAVAPLNDLGWQVESVSWRNSDTDWNKFDIVVIRTTWDYHTAPLEFIAALKQIDSSSARLENPLELVTWNVDKHYLQDLESRGCDIVPTIWFNGEITEDLVDKWRAEHNADRLVIKPTVSATAKDTFRLSGYDRTAVAVLKNRDVMVQPFMNSIVDEGEYSLFYFNGEYSHTIIKRPKQNDYRVQEEHGGIIESVRPDDDLADAALAIQNTITPLPLYSRVDLVRGNDGGFRLMELELIEPSLYFRMNDRSPALFAEQFDRRMR